MMSVLYYPNQALLSYCTKVETVDLEIKELIDRLWSIQQTHEALGVAASQIGILKQVAVVKAANQQKVLINPVILGKTDPIVEQEGCLSFPGIYVPIKRFQIINCAYINEHGEPEEEQAVGLFARAIQHEIDHLHGITLAQKLDISSRQRLMRQLKKEKKKIKKMTQTVHKFKEKLNL